MSNEVLKKLAIVAMSSIVLMCGFTCYKISGIANNISSIVESGETLKNNINEVAQRTKTFSDNIKDANQSLEDFKVKKEELKLYLKQLEEKNNELQSSLTLLRSKLNTSRGEGRYIEVECTAYTLGGNTATGFPLYGLSREEAMVIAVDPDIIPLGSQVYIEFDDDWSHYNGVYTASDTGGAIDGHIIDVFVGHGNDDEAMSFGRRSAIVKF